MFSSLTANFEYTTGTSLSTCLGVEDGSFSNHKLCGYRIGKRGLIIIDRLAPDATQYEKDLH